MQCFLHLSLLVAAAWALGRDLGSSRLCQVGKHPAWLWRSDPTGMDTTRSPGPPPLPSQPPSLWLRQ